jgi:hypothetical protein
MTSRSADKIIALAAAGLCAVILLASCNDSRSGRAGSLNNSRTTSENQFDRSDNRTASSRLDLGDDWDAAARAREDRQGDRSGRRSIRTLGQGDGRDDRTVRRDEPFWTIVLGTYSGENHEQAARNMLSELPRISPELSAARAHATSRGSLVIYGRYPSADDPRAASDLDMIKSMRFRDMPVFSRAFLSRITPAITGAASHPHELLSVRRIYPTVDPLYTLQVAAWGDFDSGTMSSDEVRRRAEEHVRRLRAQGHEAYFHHDPGRRLSVVTVGLFDRTAIDGETGDRSPELRMLMRQFPAHLVNGEELHEPIDSRRPDRGTRVQPPHLVLVPLP